MSDSDLMGQPSAPASAKRPRSPLTPGGVWTVVLAANLLFLGIGVFFLHNSRTLYVQRAEALSDNLARAMEFNLARTFAGMDQALIDAAEDLAGIGLHKTGAASAVLDAHLGRARPIWPEIENLRVTNSEGDIVLRRPDITIGKRINLSDREYFRTLRDNPGAGMVLAAPVTTRGSATEALVVARRIDNADGSFAGVVISAIPLLVVDRILATVNLGKESTLTLWTKDCRMIARAPADPKGLARSGAVARAREMHRFASSGTGQSATYVTEGVDEVERLYTARRVAGTDFLLSVGISMKNTLADWRAQTVGMSGLFVVFALASSLLGAQLARSLRQERHAYRNLIRQQEFTSKLLENMAEGVVACNASGRIVVCNRTAQGWHGVDATTLSRQEWIERRNIYREDRDTPLEPGENPLDRALSGQFLTYEPMVIRAPDQPPRHVLVNGGPFHSASGHLLGAMAVVHDYTGMRQAQISLRQLADRLMEAQRIAQVGDWVFSVDTGKVACSQQALEILGVDPSRSEMDFEDLLGLYSPQDRDRVRQARALALTEGQAYEIELGCVKPDGSERQILVRGRPERDQHGRVVRLRGSVQDITARKTVERDILESKRVAESASRAKSEFLANLSHEIRTPLNGVMGMLQLLGDGPLEDEQREFLETALQSSRDLLGILNDILDLSKIEAGKMYLCSEALRPADLAQAVCQIFRAETERKGLELRIENDPDLPKRVLGDRTRLRQVLFNLVGNAVKFTSRGSITVRTGVSADGARLVYTVTDTGVGIPESMQALVFDPFVQTDGSKTRSYAGLGLGLSIVKRLAGLMNGQVQLESEPGRGTRVTFHLPLALPDVGALAQAPGSGDPLPLPPGLVILLAEDDMVNQLSTRRLLERRGVRVLCAENGQQALEMLAGEPVDLVLMDVQMPEMDGIEATLALRDAARFGAKSRLPVIALTGRAMKVDEERCLEAGMNAFVSKPIEIQALLAVIAAHLPRS